MYTDFRYCFFSTYKVHIKQMRHWWTIRYYFPFTGGDVKKIQKILRDVESWLESYIQE